MAVKRRQKNVDICRNTLKTHINISDFVFIYCDTIHNECQRERRKGEVIETRGEPRQEGEGERESTNRRVVCIYQDN